MPEVEVGSPVRIIQDCREGGTAAGQYGVYEGNFPIYLMVKFNGEIKELDFGQYAGTVVSVGDKIIPLSEAAPIWTPDSGIPPPTKDDNAAIVVDNPLIRLESGEAIWGCECWWGAAEQAENLEAAQQEVEETKAILQEFFIRKRPEKAPRRYPGRIRVI